MLKEIQNVRQIEGEPRRRWFSDDFFDLIIWFDEDEEISGFQLCYDITRHERALTWKRKSGYRHEAVDQGEDGVSLMKSTPVMIKDGIFDNSSIIARFMSVSGDMANDLVAFIEEKISKCPVNI